MNINSRDSVGHQLPPDRERGACCDYFNQGRGLPPFSPGENNDAQLSAQTRTLRIRQRHGFDFSIEFSTSPLRAVAILTLSDFHEISRAGRPSWTAMKVVGVGSVGTRCGIALMTAASAD